MNSSSDVEILVKKIGKMKKNYNPNIIKDLTEENEEWWIKTHLRINVEEEKQIQKEQFLSKKELKKLKKMNKKKEEKKEKPACNLKLKTFHLTLKGDEDIAKIEKQIKEESRRKKEKHLQANYERHIESKKTQKPVYCMIFSVKKDFDFIENKIIWKRGRIIEKDQKWLCIAEGKRKSLKYLKNFLIKRNIHMLWEGENEYNFSDFKIVEYFEGIENLSRFLFYKSLIIKEPTNS